MPRQGWVLSLPIFSANKVSNMSDKLEFIPTIRTLLKDDNVIYQSHYKQHEKISDQAETNIKHQEHAKDVAHEVAGWLPFNTSDREKTERICRSTYLAKKQDELVTDINLGIDPNRLLPTEEGFSELLKEACNDNGRPAILLLGSRGVGKTHAINYFLSKYFNDTLKKNKYTYFRCDAAKITRIAIDLKNAGDERLPSLAEYIRSHNFYVALTHGKDDPLLEPFAQESQGEDGSFVKSIELEVRADVKGFWESCVSSISSAPNNFISEVIRKERQGFRDVSIKLNALLLSAIKKNGGKIILIIDGVDNYSREREGDIYKTLLEELQRFFTTKYNSEYYKTIICLRTNAYHELRHYPGKQHELTSPEKFLVATVNPNLFFLKRTEALSNKEHISEKYFENNLKWNDRIIEFAKDTSQYLADEFNSSNSKKGSNSKSPEQMLNFLFDGNLRSWYRNMFLSYYYYDRIYKKVTLRDNEKQVLELGNKIDISLEASMLAGSTFMLGASEEDMPDPIGRWCPNLFYCVSRSTDNQRNEIWDGLAMLRMLQLLDPKNSALALKEIIVKLKKDFRYTDKLISDNFFRAIRFNLIRFDREKHVNDDSVEGQVTAPAYLQSEKGSLLLEKVFKKPEIFYFMAASAYLPKDWVDNTNIIFLHTPLEIDRRFYEAVIKTGTSFWRMLKKSTQEK
jgi:Cdc6-like AAA superfamily ATPase